MSFLKSIVIGASSYKGGSDQGEMIVIKVKANIGSLGDHIGSLSQSGFARKVLKSRWEPLKEENVLAQSRKGAKKTKSRGMS